LANEVSQPRGQIPFNVPIHPPYSWRYVRAKDCDAAPILGLALEYSESEHAWHSLAQSRMPRLWPLGRQLIE
jgi:hypothetical protein